MLDPGVDSPEFDIVGNLDPAADLRRLAYKSCELSRFAAVRGNLVHHAARCTDDAVLDLLAEKREITWFDVDIVRVANSLHHRNLERRR